MSTREVQQMLAEVDPELAQPRDRMRALGGGRWELKAAVDAECRHGLEKLLMLLSHRDPHLTLGGLVARLVRDGLDRYDPARPPRARRPGGRGSVERAQSASQPARRNTEALHRSVVRANGSDVERPREGERDDASLAADRGVLPGASAAKRHAQTACDSTKSTPVPDDSGRTESAANRSTEAERGSASAAAAVSGGDTASPAKRRSKAEHGGASPAAAPNSGKHTTSAPKRRFQAELGRPSRAAARDGSGRVATAANRPSETEHGGASPVAAPNGGGHAASPAKRPSETNSVAQSVPRRETVAAVAAPKRDTEAGRGGAKYSPAADVGGRAGSAAKRRGQAGGAGRDARVGGGLDRTMAAAGAGFEADRRDAARAPGQCGTRVPTSAAKRLAYAAGHGSGRPAERSPALQRHLAALRCVGAVPGSRSRYIPVAVRREVWRRDQGRCSYVDRHSGRRCGSRYRLQIDHIVPFALGGGAEPANLRLHCEAHHRLRHAQRQVHAESVPTEVRHAPVFAVDRNDATWDGRQVGSIGDIGCFSLQSSKAVSGIEADVATTDDPAKERGRTVGARAAIERVGA